MVTSLRRVSQDLSKLEKYSLAPGLGMNFSFLFKDAEVSQKPVLAVHLFQLSFP